MNEAIFEADQQPAKPMTGDRPGDQPVTPSATPEQGELERTARYFLGTWRYVDQIIAAHKRDMAALSGELNVFMENVAATENLLKSNITELEAEVERLRKESIRVCRWTPLDEDCPGAYETACDHAYQFESGWLKDNASTKYCPRCGGRIVDAATPQEGNA